MRTITIMTHAASIYIAYRGARAAVMFLAITIGDVLNDVILILVCIAIDRWVGMEGRG
jgi:hypothetical protein